MSQAQRACIAASRLARITACPRVAYYANAGPSQCRSASTSARPSKPRFGLRSDPEPSPVASLSAAENPRSTRVADRVFNSASSERVANVDRVQESGASPTNAAETARSTQTGGIDSVAAWTKAGLSPPVVDRLLSLYPECIAPTPAQLAFLLAVAKGDVDIYLKDYMGRGKTFALVLAALTIVSSSKGRVVMMLPSPHLVKQIEDLLAALGPDVTVSTATMSDDAVNLNARILLGTPKALLALGTRKRNMDLGARFRATHVFVDEVDTQLGPLPSSRATPAQLKRHPSRLHTPAVASALNSLFGITVLRDGSIDFSRRREITSVFSSATLDNNARRHIYGKGWVRPKGERAFKSVVDLDFSANATPRQVELRETMAQIAARAGAVAAEPGQRKPRHYAFTVGAEGRIAPLDLQRTESQGYVPPVLDEAGRQVDLDSLPLKKGNGAAAAAKPRPGLPVTLLEGMAYLHTTVPPPPGTYSLAVLPDGASISSASTELEALGLTVLPLVPEVLAGGVSPPALDAPHIMLLTTRAAVPGLHLPHLHSIYLVNGLDVSKLSKAAKEAGGREGQSLVYSIITGRLGRFATEVYDAERPQRVVSIVQDDSYEEWALRHLFGEKFGKWEFALSQWPGELS